MANNLPALLQPIQMGTMELRNRIVMPGLTRGRANKTTREATELMEEYYSQRGLAGLIITEGTFISDQAIGWDGAPAIYTKEQTESWRRLVTEFKRKTGNKSAIFMQLWHAGRASHSSFHPRGNLPVAASSLPLTGVINTPYGKLPTEVPYALSNVEIREVVEDFKHAAENAKSAGFMGIEIHAADGYLIDTFLQSKTNLRSDEYGGSFENRFRFLKEILEAVCTVFPSDRVGVRLSPNGVLNETGSLDFRESFLYYFQQLNLFNLAYLHVVDGLDFGFHKLGKPITLSEVKSQFRGRVIGNCGYDFASANAAIENGDADLISFGRMFIANPDLVERFANGWPLNAPAPFSVWYSEGPAGYVDFPTYNKV